MPSDTFVSKAQLNDGNVYLKLQWRPSDQDLFHLQILCDDCAWKGIFSNELAQQYMSNLHQSTDEYHENTQECLTGGSGYELEISVNRDETGTFRWKKIYEDDNLKQVQGSMSLHRDTTPKPRDSLIDFLIGSNDELKSTIALLKQNIEEMSADLDRCKVELEKFIDIKTAVEENLYGKFVQLLNTKKQRIKLLEDQLKNYLQ